MYYCCFAIQSTIYVVYLIVGQGSKHFQSQPFSVSDLSAGYGKVYYEKDKYDKKNHIFTNISWKLACIILQDLKICTIIHFIVKNGFLEVNVFTRRMHCFTSNNLILRVLLGHPVAISHAIPGKSFTISLDNLINKNNPIYRFAAIIILVIHPPSYTERMAYGLNSSCWLW